MFDKIGDLPAHPLIVHLPIVLGPLVGLMAIACLVPKWRDRLLKPTAGLAVLFAIACIIAAESGESLMNTLQVGAEIHDHEEAADTLKLIAIVFAIVSVGVVLLRSRLKGALDHAAVVLIAVLGLATIGFTIETGHEGAKAVWKDEYQQALQNKTPAP